MRETAPVDPGRSGRWRRWIRTGFLLWACISTLWLANSVRTQGVDESQLQSGDDVSVVDSPDALEFRPASANAGVGLVFFCGSGIAAEAYAPLLRPLAAAGYSVFVIRLPYRFAPLETHKVEAVERARRVLGTHSEFARWVISGHSLGGALAARMAKSDSNLISAMVLIGTTHPKKDDLSSLPFPVTKIYAANDGIASPDQVMANRHLLPEHTKWLEIAGGNHSQFGHYGHQLFDGTATISREEQQAITRTALLEALNQAARYFPRQRPDSRRIPKAAGSFRRSGPSHGNSG